MDKSLAYNSFRPLNLPPYVKILEQNEPCAEKKSSLSETRTRGTCLGSVAIQLERVLFELNTLHGTI